MKILHTSDWHLGRSLYGRKRYAEFSAFLNWLADTIESENIDALLVSGDIFDTTTPGNRAQELYYKFLHRVATSCCRHTIIIAGNHDSPTFLNAPREILKAFNIHIVGAMNENPADEVIVLYKAEQPEAIICAVPYLRDRDIRTVTPGETIDDKNAKLISGLKDHYAAVCDIAEQKQTEFRQSGFPVVPIVAMGHLFTSGGKTVDGDGVRDLYVGSLAHIGADTFPPSVNYVALGHLHVPQQVGGSHHIRYSGSPIPMGYGEAKQEKRVILVEFADTTPDIREITVPCFQQLVRISGSLEDIHSKLDELKASGSQAWVEIEYTGSSIVTNLKEVLDDALAGSQIEVSRTRNRRLIERVINTIDEHETLDDLDENDVFERCLDAFEVLLEERGELKASYDEIIRNLHEKDLHAE
jgi:exonuclease SbcD